MSKPDYDGVYRTPPTVGVFGREKRPEIAPQATPKAPSKKAHPPKHKGAAPQPPTPTEYSIYSVRGLEGNLGGDPTPITPMGDSWVEVGWKGKKTHRKEPLVRSLTGDEIRAMEERAGLRPKRTAKAKKPTLVIIEDTREQTPLTDWPEGTQVENRGLDTGDYSIAGWENCFAIERKSITDLAGTMISGYEPNTQKPRRRFNNELERMRHFDCAAVIVTATPAEMLEFKHNCGMDAHAALWHFGLSIFATYGIPVFALTDAKTAARWIYDLARHYITVRTKKNRSMEDRAKKVADDWKF